MTDEVASVAAAEAVAAPEPVVPETIQTPEAIAPEPAKAEAKPEPSPREAIQRAMAKLKGEQEAPKAEGDQNRDPATGRFQAKDATAQPETGAEKQLQPKVAEQPQKPQTPPANLAEVPARLRNDPALVSEWGNLSEAVRGGVVRTVSELENGLAQYKQDATAFNDIREFDNLAKANNTTIKQAMTNYVNLDRLIQQNPVEGMKAVCDSVGLNLLDLAHQIVGMNPGYEPKAQESELVRSLRNELAEVRRQVAGVAGDFETQRVESTRASISSQVAAFAQSHPRFAELEAEIASLIAEKNMSLDEAYAYAEWKNPLPPAPTVQVPARPQTPPAAGPQTPTGETRRGTLTITGSPGIGSNPSARIPSTSIRESLERARSAVG